MRIGHYVPAYRGQLRAELVNSILQDYTFCINAGHEFRHWWGDMQPVDRSRNIAVDRARSMGCDRLAMYDADVWAKEDGSALEAMMSTLDAHEDAAAVGAVCVLRDGLRVNVEPALLGEVYPCEKIGAGILLLDLARLDALRPEHVWFRFELDEPGTGLACGEDVYFCREIRRLGGQVYANYQIPTRHSGTSPLYLERHGRRPIEATTAAPTVSGAKGER